MTLLQTDAEEAMRRNPPRRVRAQIHGLAKAVMKYESGCTASGSRARTPSPSST